MDDFETCLQEVKHAVERSVRFRVSSKTDADDILQETYLAAYRNFAQLKDRTLFKPWILRIAKNKCNDWFRKTAETLEIPIEEQRCPVLLASRRGIAAVSAVRETLDTLGGNDRQILYLYYWKEMPQAEIAKELKIPLGTVKSRLFIAKQHFKQQYPYPPRMKGETAMKEFPMIMPEYTVTPSEKAPFSVKWEELMGWFLVPKPGEKLQWAMYDFPQKTQTSFFDMAVARKAKVHGIEGVEIVSREMSCANAEDVTEYTFVAQLTDTHCRYLAAFREENGVRDYVTFLDSDEFMPNWGFGENNCGNEVNLSPKGDIIREGNCIKSVEKEFLLDIVGRYTVTINGKTYDTVCVMDLETYNDGTASEQFLDRNGRTVLWRRFNRDDWAIDRFGGKPWSEKFPENERIFINGKTYVHWYDCITDYIL